MVTLKPNTIIVTGGTGFIGSCVIKQLNCEGYENIVVVDNLRENEKWKNLVGKRFDGIISPQKFFTWLKSVDLNQITAVFHLGACSDTTEKNADYLLENNTHFSQQLVEIALLNKWRFIYASSAATYGDGKLGFDDDHDKLLELKPLNMYGYSKHLFDLWLKKNHLLEYVVGLKYFNVFGPNENHKNKMASAIAQIYPVIMKEHKVKLFKSSDPAKFADGEQKRDFIYVKDVARITTSFLSNSNNGIFNVGRGVALSWNRLAQAIFKALRINGIIEYIEMPEVLIGKYQNYTCANTDKLRKAIGKLADCGTLEDDVCDYICNHLNNDKTW